MLRVGAALLAVGWLVLVGMYLSGTLAWDNRLLWVCFAVFPASCTLGLVVAVEGSGHRLMGLGVAAAGLASCLLLGVGYFFLFGLVGK